MCLAIPAKILSLDAATGNATACLDEVKVEISLALLDAADVGDYVLVHAGFALCKLDEQEALATLALFEQAGFGHPA